MTTKLALFTGASNIIDELRAEGFAEGPPSQLTAEELMGDLAAYRRLVCEECGHTRQDVQPFHRGKEYRLALVCRKCGHQTEA